LTSLACAVLLFRGYARSGARLLLWSTFCFVGLTLNNAFLYLDAVVLPQFDLSMWRGITGVAGVCFLLYGMIMDAD
jgi:hypothetical protein